MKFLLDTNICIYIINRKPAVVIERMKQTGVDSIALSSITLAELSYGVEKSERPVQNRLALIKFLLPFPILAFDDTSAFAYGQIRAHMEKTGSIIGSLDLLIGAQAISAGLTLITNNTREFSQVPELRIENWVDYT